jgi:uncharacterized protein YjgD (DUF1641 family)
MDLPKIPKDQLPEEVQEQIEGDVAEFDQISDEMIDTTVLNRIEQKKSERQLQKNIEELSALNEIFKKRQNMTSKEFIRKVKKNKKYYRSSLYEVQRLEE